MKLKTLDKKREKTLTFQNVNRFLKARQNFLMALKAKYF